MFLRDIIFPQQKILCFELAVECFGVGMLNKWKLGSLDSASWQPALYIFFLQNMIHLFFTNVFLAMFFFSFSKGVLSLHAHWWFVSSQRWEEPFLIFSFLCLFLSHRMTNEVIPEYTNLLMWQRPHHHSRQSRRTRRPSHEASMTKLLSHTRNKTRSARLWPSFLTYYVFFPAANVSFSITCAKT